MRLKYIDIDQLPGWDSVDRWMTKHDTLLPDGVPILEEVKEDAGKPLQFCFDEEIKSRPRKR